MTPRELSREVEGLVRRRQDQHERDLVLAWNAAYYYALSQSKQGLPSLAAEVEKRVRAQVIEQTSPTAVRAQVGELAARLNVPLQPWDDQTRAALARLAERKAAAMAARETRES